MAGVLGAGERGPSAGVPGAGGQGPGGGIEKGIWGGKNGDSVITDSLLDVG